MTEATDEARGDLRTSPFSVAVFVRLRGWRKAIRLVCDRNASPVPLVLDRSTDIVLRDGFRIVSLKDIGLGEASPIATPPNDQSGSHSCPRPSGIRLTSIISAFLSFLGELCWNE